MLTQNVAPGDGRQPWQTLTEKYSSGAKDGDGYPKAKKLLNAKLSPHKDLSAHTCDFDNTHNELVKALEADPDEPIKGLPQCTLKGLFLEGLTPSYENVVTIIETTLEKPQAMKTS